MLKALYGFFEALPEIMALIKSLTKRIEEEGVQRKLADDVKTIHDAFEAKDATKLNALFNGPAPK